MEPLAEQLIREHIVDLHREAAASRLVKAASRTNRGEKAGRAPRAARLVSSGLMFLAVRLDPTIRRPSYGRE